ncbi:hypothetical protein M1589_04885 [Candidatus Marsarchaeota archaeon]|nr:hypothetical protein [Candidatus Marsarchaeota archaeon]MCL5115446.1 hypothetical protein [Candidatus Marsarchaeota archaeon]
MTNRKCPREKVKQDSIVTKELITIFSTVVTLIILYLFFRESLSANIIYASVISLGATYLIMYTFELNGDIEEERVFFNTIISIIILLFASLTSLDFLNSSICNNSSNSIKIHSCSFIIPLTSRLYGAFLIMFLIILFAGITLRLKHKKSEKIFSKSKFISYLALIFLILFELILILSIAGILPLNG